MSVFIKKKRQGKKTPRVIKRYEEVEIIKKERRIEG